MNSSLGISMSPLFAVNKLLALKNAGFDYVELSAAIPKAYEQSKYVFPTLKQEADMAGITIRSIHIPFGNDIDPSEANEAKRKSYVDYIAEILKAYSIFKPEIAVLHASFEPISDDERSAKMAAAKKSIAEINGICLKYGMTLAVEDLPRTCLGNTSADIKELISVDERIGVCFDSNHLTKQDNLDFLNDVGDRVITVHFSDYDGIDEKHWIPLKGIVDWKGVISKLDEAGYNGPAVFELHDTVTEPYPQFMYEVRDTWHKIVK